MLCVVCCVQDAIRSRLWSISPAFCYEDFDREQSASSLSDTQRKALDDFLLWLFETQLATRCESRGYVFEPDDIVAFELNKNLALYIDVKDGILPVEGDFGREFLLETVYPHVLTMACIVG